MTMDVEKLIERLKSDAADWNGDRYIKRDLLDAAEALEKLQAENESLKNKLHDSYQGHLLDVVIPRMEAELEKVKAERDAAVNDLQRIKSCKVCKHCEPLKTLIPEICRKCSHGNQWEWRGQKED